MRPVARPGSKLPPRSAGVESIRSTPRSSAATPRVIGAEISARCFIGEISCSKAVMKAMKPPMVVLSWPLCQSAAVMTVASATEAMTWVIGVIVAAARTALIEERRSLSLTARKRAAWLFAAACRRTLRQAMTFSSTT